MDCLDIDDRRCEEKVLRVHNTTFQLHYIGWLTKYDMTEHTFTNRIQQCNTQRRVWRLYIAIRSVVKGFGIKTAQNGMFQW